MLLKKSNGSRRNQRENQKIPQDNWKWKHNFPKSMGCSKSSSRREVYSNTGLPSETRKTLNKQPKLPSKELEKEEQTKPKVSRRKEIIKIRQEIK